MLSNAKIEKLSNINTIPDPNNQNITIGVGESFPIIQRNIDKDASDVVKTIKRNEGYKYHELKQLDPNRGSIVGNVPVPVHEVDDREEDLIAATRLKDKFDPNDLYFGKLDPEKYVPLLDKLNAEKENELFEQFVLKSVDPNNAYQMKQIQEMFPEIWDRRRKIIENEADKYKKLAKINMTGKINTREDYILLFNIANGLVDFNPTVLDSLMFNTLDQYRSVGYDNNNKEFTSGKLNFSKFVKYISTPKAVNAVDISKPFKVGGTLNTIDDDEERRSVVNSSVVESKKRFDAIRGLFNIAQENENVNNGLQ